jgi:RNA polymerase sigma factor (sigma-70 family)
MNPSLNNSFPPDTELVTRSLAGEHQAFGALVTRHQGAACGVAYSVCGDFPASEDVAQEAFVSAWKQLGTLRETGRFRAWVCGIARQIALSQIRRRDRRGDRPPSDLPNETAQEDASPRDEAILSEESALLWQTLDRLPETYREPLVLFYREQQSVNAVATALELSEDSVKQRLSRGRAMLREELAQQIEGVLGRTQPGTAFTAAVLSALPPIAIGAGLTVGASSAKAATIGGASSTATAGGATGAALAASAASGVVGLLSLYVFYRFLRTPEIPGNIRRIVARTAAGSFGISVLFAGFILWIALTRGAPLIALGFSPALVLTLAIGAFVTLNVALSLRASRLLASLPLHKHAHLVRGYRYVSRWQLAGFPVVSLAFGADFSRNEKRGTARGWIAIGDVAFGVVAIGGIAVGPIAIGGVSLGILALGGGAAGLVALGGIALGWASCGGVALAWDFAAGGLAIAHHLALGGLALASEQAFGGIALAPLANNPTAWASLNAHPAYGMVIALLPHLGWLSLLSLPGLIIALRHLHRNKR